MADRILLPKTSDREISVGGDGADIAGFDSKAIQTAVDALKAVGGGTVRLGCGTYAIHGPIRLGDNCKLVGAGSGTILRKADGFRSRFAIDADYGELFIMVEDASGFQPGTGIMVSDSHYQYGWDVTTAIISSMEGNQITIDTYLLRDYTTDYCGVVSNACSIIEGVGVHDAGVYSLVIDGNKCSNDFLNGCRGGGIYFHKASACAIEDVTLKDFSGDGFSWQIDTDITVRNCDISGCAGFGLHPGTGSLRTRIEGCKIHHNGSDGLFVCWRVQHGVIVGNSFYANGGCGINIGHKDTDNLFESNHIYENALCGILMRTEKPCNSAHRNVYRKNLIENNGSDEAGYGILIECVVEDVRIEGNVIRDTGKSAQRVGIMIRCETPGLQLGENVFSGNREGETIYS